MPTKWEPEQYLKFEHQRKRPAIDLAMRIPLENPKKIIDIGCGTGSSTYVLQKRFPEASILGVDLSEEMLATAREKYPELNFEKCDAQTDLEKLDHDYNIVFSNACLQWIPDHPKMIRQMLSMLAPSGVLAVQLPMNDDEPIHKLIARLVESPKWRDNFVHPRPMYHLSPATYYDLLSEEAEESHMWMTTYFHHMAGHEALVEWYKGTGLRPYLQALTAEKQEVFLADVLKEVKRAYHLQKDGTVMFRFPRLFFIAIREKKEET